MDSEKTFRKEELNNNLLREIFKRNFSDYKIYDRNDDGTDKIIVQKNGSVAVSAFVKKENDSKVVEYGWCDTDSFFHMKILPWLLIIFGVFPGIIWFIVHMVGRSNLHEECLKVNKRYFTETSLVGPRNLEVN